MKICLAVAAMGVAGAITVAAQNPRFARANIRLAPQGIRVVRMDLSRGICMNCDLKSVIAFAYRVRADLLFGPSTLQSIKVNIEAESPPGQRDSVPEMLVSLLEERMHLVAQREERGVPGFELRVDPAGLKIAPARPAPGQGDRPVLKFPDDAITDPAGDGTPQNAPSRRGAVVVIADNQGRWTIDSNQTMLWLAQHLSGPTHQPVIDSTGLKGTYPIRLSWTPATMVRDLQTQLGIVATRKQVTVDVVTVRHIDRKPTAN